MEDNNYRIALIREFTPPWARSISYSANWEEAISTFFSNSVPSVDSEEAMKPLTSSEIRPQTNKFSYAQFRDTSLIQYDALYLSGEDIPKDVKDFILIFRRLSPGAIVVLEWQNKGWRRRELSRIFESVGGKLLYFGSANVYLKKRNNYNREIVVFQNELPPTHKKKASIIVPINSPIKGKSRVFEWICFIDEMHLSSSVELVLVFDGIEDILPAWKECEDLEKEGGLQMIRHYRSFGLGECLRSALYFSVAKVSLWDNYHFACPEFFAIFNKYLENGLEYTLKSPLGIFASAIKSDYKGGSLFANKSNDSFVDYFILNKLAAKLLYYRYRPKASKHSMSSMNSMESRGEILFSEVKSILKKNRAKIYYEKLIAP